jgi:hypothetical protein
MGTGTAKFHVLNGKELFTLSLITDAVTEKAMQFLMLPRVI